MSHVNRSDTDFLHDLLHLLRGGLRAGELAERVSDDPWTRAAALESVLASRREITEVATCLDEWDLAGFAAPRSEAPMSADAAFAGALEVDLAGRSGNDFDTHFTRVLLAHHHAVIGRSRQEMIEGLSTRSRDIAALAIAEHSAGVSAVERGTARPGASIVTGLAPAPAVVSKPSQDPMYDAMVRGIDLVGGALPIPEPRLVVDGRPDLSATQPARSH